MGELKKWREQKWVRIGTDGKIKGMNQNAISNLNAMEHMDRASDG